MARKPTCTAGQQLGVWTLVEFIDSGSNGEVWRATNASSEEAAVKILFTKDSHSEPYKRFRDEVKVLTTLGDFPGILPLLDSSLPTQPSKDNRAWFAMPLAVPILEVIGDEPELEVVVDLVASVAETLARLSEQGISHRDIKPQNLYRYNDSWVVGDFGLVEYPGKEPITTNSKQLGPAHFYAPEMLTDPANADGSLADVYSLAKTLYVLATGQRYPPAGPQRINDTGATISSWVVHEKVSSLDWLNQRATARDPRQRPTMAEFAVELREWLKPRPDPASPPDMSALAKEFANLEVVRRQPRDEHQAKVNAAEELRQEIVAHMGELASAFAKVFPNTTPFSNNTLFSMYYPRHRGMSLSGVYWSGGLGMSGHVLPAQGKSDMYLWCWFFLECMESGDVCVTFAYIANPPGSMTETVGGEQIIVVAPFQSAVMWNKIDDAINELIHRLPQAVNEYFGMVQ